MEKKIDYMTLGRDGVSLMNEFDAYLNTLDVDPLLRELIKIRTSQINGCAYCLDVHTKVALNLGETPRRLMVLSAWKDADGFSPAEKSVLNLVDHVTRVSTEGVPTEVHDDVRLYYSDTEYVVFVFIINHMNAWNRLSISMGNRVVK